MSEINKSIVSFSFQSINYVYIAHVETIKRINIIIGLEIDRVHRR
jgi:hypothetical protein